MSQFRTEKLSAIGSRCVIVSSSARPQHAGPHAVSSSPPHKHLEPTKTRLETQAYKASRSEAQSSLFFDLEEKILQATVDNFLFFERSMCHETCKVARAGNRRASMNLPNRKRTRCKHISAPLIAAALLLLQPHVLTRSAEAFSQVQPTYGLTCVRSAGIIKSSPTFGCASEAYERKP